MDNARRGHVLKGLLVVSCIQASLFLILILLGSLAGSVHGTARDSVPVYFAGPLGAAILNVLLALIGLCIYIRGKKCSSKREAAQKIGALMLAFCLAVLISTVGHVIASMITGFSGVCPSSHCSYLTEETTNRRLAITSLVFIIIGAVCGIAGVVVVCFLSSSFGLKIFNRSHHQIGVDPTQTPTDIFQVTISSPRQDDQIPSEQVHQQHVHQQHVHQHVHEHEEHEFRNHVVESLHETAGKFSHPTVDHHEQTRRHLDHLVYEKKHKRQKKRKPAKRVNGNNGKKRNGREASYTLPPLPGVGPTPTHSPDPPPSPPPFLSANDRPSPALVHTQPHRISSPPHMSPSPPPPPTSPTRFMHENSIPTISILNTPVLTHSPPPPYTETDEDPPRHRPMVVFVRPASSPSSSVSTSSSETPPLSGRLLLDYLKPTSHSPPPMTFPSRSPTPSLASADDFPNMLNPHPEPPPPRPITPPLLRPSRLFVQPASRHQHNYYPPSPSDSECEHPDLPDSNSLPQLRRRPTTPPSYMAMISTRPLNDTDM